MKNAILNNPWTSLVGTFVAVLAGFIMFAPQYFPPIALDAAKFIAVGGAAALGLAANDPRKVTSVNK